MGAIGWPQLLIIGLVILVLFGRGRIAEMMGDFGKGISSFKKGMKEEENTPSTPSAQIEAPAETPTQSAAKDAATPASKTEAETSPSERSDSAN
ncbi:MAG: twin-arginine translocase TatA/TatE family subunit [Erythrobacter sp.]